MKFVFVLVLVWILNSLGCKLEAQHKELLWQGGVSVLVPDNSFLKFKTDPENFGFATAADIGYGFDFSTLWFFNSAISWGAELGYSYFPKDDKTWYMANTGNIRLNYQISNLSLLGNIYFSESDIRPYGGALFGLYYLRNMLDFNSNYGGTDNDASVSYISHDFLAGFGLECGVLMDIQNNMYLNVSIRYTMIPDLQSTYYEDIDVTMNPHEKENHWALSVKLLWNKNK